MRRSNAWPAGSKKILQRQTRPLRAGGIHVVRAGAGQLDHLVFREVRSREGQLATMTNAEFVVVVENSVKDGRCQPGWDHQLDDQHRVLSIAQRQQVCTQ